MAMSASRPQHFVGVLQPQVPGGQSDQRHKERRGQGRGQARPPGRPPPRSGGDLADVLGRRIGRQAELRAEQAPERGRVHLLAGARLLVRRSELRRGRRQVETVAAAHQVLLETRLLLGGKLAAMVGDPLVGRGVVHRLRGRVDQLHEGVAKVG